MLTTQIDFLMTQHSVFENVLILILFWYKIKKYLKIKSCYSFGVKSR